MDYQSGLPVRSKQDVDERLQSKIVDFETPSQGAAVDTDKNLHVEIHGNDPLDADKILRLSQSGNIALDGDYDLTNNSNPSSVGLIVHDRAETPSISGQNFRPTGIKGTVNNQVHALDVAIHDEAGNPFSQSNPMPVQIQGGTIGTPIKNRETTADLAKNTETTHSYTVTAGKKLTLSKVHFSATGEIKCQVKVGPVGSTVIVYDGFNSTACKNVDYSFVEDLFVNAGEVVELVIKNIDNTQAFDVYSLLEGEEN